MQVQSLGEEDPLEKEMAPPSSIFAWENPWTEESGGLQSMGLQRVGHDWATEQTHTHTHTWLVVEHLFMPLLATYMFSSEKNCLFRSFPHFFKLSYWLFLLLSYMNYLCNLNVVSPLSDIWFANIWSQYINIEYLNISIYHFISIFEYFNISFPFLKKLYLFIFGWAGFLLPRHLFSSCGMQTSHCSGFSCCRARAVGHLGFSSCSSRALAPKLNSCGAWT